MLQYRSYNKDLSITPKWRLFVQWLKDQDHCHLGVPFLQVWGLRGKNMWLLKGNGVWSHSHLFFCAEIIAFYSNGIMALSSVTSCLITWADCTWQSSWWLLVYLINTYGVLVYKVLDWKVDSKQQFIPKNHWDCVSSGNHNFCIRAAVSPHEAFVQIRNRYPFLNAFYFHLSENCHAEFIRTIPSTTVSWKIVKTYKSTMSVNSAP